jgi:hypothetical protein
MAFNQRREFYKNHFKRRRIWKKEEEVLVLNVLARQH